METGSNFEVNAEASCDNKSPENVSNTPSQGSDCVKNSRSAIPNDQISLGGVALSLPNKHSGAIYGGVPSKIDSTAEWLRTDMEACWRRRPSPKSHNFSTFCLETSTLAGFMSLWTTFNSCKYATPFNISLTTADFTASFTCSSSSMYSWRVFLSTNSVTNKTSFFLIDIPINVTIFRWWSRLWIFASLSMDSLTVAPRRICLIATSVHSHVPW